ncbi:MAG: 3'-5' exonuclease, partial [Bacteroidota bacterium]
MLNNVSLNSILCLDIETVPQYPSFVQLPDPVKKLWLRKAEFLKRKESEEGMSLYERAGIYAEFGKIICITIGYITGHSRERKFRLQSFFGDDEKELLASFI